MLKVNVGQMRMRVKATYRVTGSVLNDTIQGEMVGAQAVLEVESPVPTNSRTLLNGEPLAEP